jgi:hypothetical protein
MFDRWLASDADKMAAKELASFALRDHGAEAEKYLAGKLEDRRRSRSRRVIRLAIAEVRAEP